MAEKTATPRQIMASMQADLRGMESYLEGLLAQTREHAAERERLHGLVKTLLAHTLRLVRQKEVLLELLGRQALSGLSPPPVLHRSPTLPDDAEFEANLARALKEMRGPHPPLTPQ